MADSELNIINEDPFSQMTWKEFEDYVVEVLSCYYKKHGLQMHKTPYVNDGGKDGYASFLIAPTNFSEVGSELSHETLFWAEVKKRTKASVNEGDIGGHVILALDHYVHKLIFVTNGSFTERAKNTCAKVGRRLNMSVAFIDGAGLLQLADNLQFPLVDTTPLVMGAPQNNIKKQDYMSVKTGFVSHQDHDLFSDGTLHAEPGEIIFWVCEVSGFSSKGGVTVEPIVNAHDESFLSVNCLSKDIVKIDITDSIYRITYSVWTNYPGEYSCKDIFVDLKTSNGMPVQYSSSNTILKVRHSILDNGLLFKRKQVVDSITTDFNILSDTGGVRGCLLEAEGGAGKTFVINKVRQKLLSQGLFELYLDGAQHRAASDVIQSLVQQSFPIPTDISINIDPVALQKWLSNENAPGISNDKLADDLLSIMSGHLESRLEPQYSASALASTLSKSSNASPILIVFEDLHKVNPSVLNFLEKLFSQLSVRKQGCVYFLFSTRPMTDGDKEEQGKWFKALGELCCSQEKFQHHYLSSLELDEALQLLKKSLRGLSDFEALSIIEQVGTNPFYLKESLLYLRSLKVIDGDAALGSFVSDYAGIEKAVSSKTLQSASRKRLELLIKDKGELFRDFLLTCACLGKFFSLEMATAAFPNLDQRKIFRIITIFERSDILRFSNLAYSLGNENCAFDHDLVRLAVFQSVGSFHVMQVAGKLIDKISSIEETNLLFRLSYLANRSSLCLDTLDALIRRAAETRRHQEALEYSLAMAAITLNTSDFFGKADFLLPYLKRIDDSLGFVNIPKEDHSIHDEKLLEILASPLEQMDKIGIFPDELSSRLITLGAMNAEKYSTTNHKSLFKFYEGRLRFGQSNYDAATELFRAAEKYWPKAKGARSKLLSDIRMRIAICERHLGRLDNARMEMRRALSLRNGVDWSLFEEVAASLGAIYMYEDQDQARRYWLKGLKVAQRTGDQHQVAHFLNDIGHLDIMLNKYEDAEKSIDKALVVAEKHGVLKESIRSGIFYGCINIAKNKTEAATIALTKAENEAFTQHNLRRLWRIRANLATIAEIEERIKDAYIKDRQSLAHMPIANELEKVNGSFKRRTRVSGALVNIVFRYRRFPELYKSFKNLIGKEAWEYAEGLHQVLSSDPEDLGDKLGGIACLYKPVGNHGLRRFLLTE